MTYSGDICFVFENFMAIQEFTSRGYPTKCNHVSLPVYAITKTLHVNSFVPHEYSPYIQNDSNAFIRNKDVGSCNVNSNEIIM
jgi:hypothetical protein